MAVESWNGTSWTEIAEALILQEEAGGLQLEHSTNTTSAAVIFGGGNAAGKLFQH